MNCKPGDLAILIKTAFGRKVGCIVTVNFFIGDFDLNFVGPERNIWQVSLGSEIYYAPDAWLRPVSGLPMQDEVIEKIKEPA